MAAGALFEVEGAGVSAGTVLGSSAAGAAVELLAQAELVGRGHVVAVPVVDDDGVDLVVGYSITVQVKATGQLSPAGTPVLKLKRNSYRRRRDGTRVARVGVLPDHVDVLLVYVRGVGWYVVPRSEVPPSGLVFGPRTDQWREAWDVFDGGRRAARV